MREKRHTSYGGRADQAADSPQAKPTKQETPAAARMRRMREKKRGMAVTPLLRPVTPNVTNVTPSVTPSQAQPVTRNVTPSPDIQALADGVKLALGLIKSLETRISAMEVWAEGLEARLSLRRPVPPLVLTSSASAPHVIHPGDMVEVNGRAVKVPALDADGQAIPE